MDWNEMARPWLDAAPYLEASFGPVFNELFKTADLQPGDTVLDVGCGTGPTLEIAAQAVGGSGRVVGIDVAPPLVARAAERVPSNVEVIVGDAGSYAYGAGAFDAIVANFGIMFFQDNEAAFENLRTATKQGGRLTATAWAKPAENPWFSIPRRIVDTVVADVPRPDPLGPGPVRFGDPAQLNRYLENTGWTPDIRTIDLTLTPPGTAEDFVNLQMNVNVAMMLKGMDVTADQLDAIKAALAEATQDFVSDGHVRVPARIHVVQATAR